MGRNRPSNHRNESRFRKSVVTTRFAPAFQCRLQDLLGGADQVSRRLDAQVGVLGQGECLLPHLFGKLPISERLQTPGDAAKQELFVIRTGWLRKQFEILGAQFPDTLNPAGSAGNIVPGAFTPVLEKNQNR